MAERIEIIGVGEMGALRRPKPYEAWRTVEVEAPDSVKLDTGEYVDKAKFGELSSAHQAYLKKHGVEAFNIEQEERVRVSEKAYEEAVSYVEKEEVTQEEWERENLVEVGPEKEMVHRQAFEKLSSEGQTLLKEVGVEEFNRRAREKEVIFETAHTQLPDGQWIDNEQLAKFQTEAPNIYTALTTGGFVAADKIIADRKEALGQLVEYKVLPFSEALMYEMVKSGDYTTSEAVALREAGAEYNVIDAISAGFPEDIIERAFSPQVVQDAKAWIEVNSYMQGVYQESFEKVEEEFLKETVKDQRILMRDAGLALPALSFLEFMKKEVEWGKVDSGYADLTVDEKAAFLNWYGTLKGSIFGVPVPKWVEAETPMITRMIHGAVPVYGTIKYWDEMPTWAKGVSIVGDILFFTLPFIIPKVTTAIKGIGTIDDQARLASIIAANLDDATRLLGEVDPKLLGSYKSLIPLMSNYSDDFAKLTGFQTTLAEAQKSLLTLGKGTTQYATVQELIATSINQIDDATRAVWLSKTALSKAANSYIDDVIRSISDQPPSLFHVKGKQISFDPATVADIRAAFADIPDKLLKSIEYLSAPPTAVNLSALRAELLLKQNELFAVARELKALEGTAASYKGYVDAASKLNQRAGDLVAQVAELKGKLVLAEVGDIAGLHSRWVIAQESLPGLEYMLRSLDKGTIQYQELVTEIARLKDFIRTAPDQIANALKAMQIEWVPETGSFGGGGNVAVLSPATIKGLVGTVRIASTATMTPEQLARLSPQMALLPVIAKPLVPREERLPEISVIISSLTRGQLAGVEPLTLDQIETIVATTGLTQVQIEAVTEAGTIAQMLSAPVEVVSIISDEATRAAIEAYNKAITEGLTTTEAEAAAEAAAQAAIQAATRQAIQAATETITDITTQAAAETAAETATRAATEVAVKTAVQAAVRVVPTPIPTPTVTIPFPTPTKKDIAGRDIYEKGTVVWKQGAWWKIIPPPYDVLKPISSRKAPSGVTVLRGTPQQTLTFIGGVIPFSDVSFDLGVVDGFIDVKNRRIQFTGRGLKTDVGKRLPSPTKGLSIPAVSTRITDRVVEKLLEFDEEKKARKPRVSLRRPKLKRPKLPSPSMTPIRSREW